MPWWAWVLVGLAMGSLAGILAIWYILDRTLRGTF